ncbi:PKHA3-like protein [Mya arenaria]|uniref:Pleckstrin homology domain-containing family A member 8 n=1 Tax=Mya arenaria TaxID=6604 RepID=A0ABY7ELP7_MYAAR|nr:PKHA3-like protein [Mya arenaria]
MYIAGTLWKWTNYFSGWQERWFVLDNGILSYYKSEDDVNTGCKGSVKMSVCDIAVHATDHTRLDLIIPGEQHFYLKASNPKERQQWLVAMGSTKASMGKANEEPEDNSKDVLKKKRSELRLYCDLLMQQIHSKFDDASSLIHPTCDMFIKTLEECMELVQIASVNFEAPHSPITDAALPPSPLHRVAKKKKVKTKYQVNPEEFSTLQRIVKHEITKKQQFNPSSASMALLWLKRSLEFISGFLNEIRQGEENLSVAATNAYSTSLKPFHGWVVRGVFAVAVKALPYRSTFLPLLDPSPNREQTDKQSFLDSLMSDIESFCDASKVFVDILDDYFKSNGLNVEEQI